METELQITEARKRLSTLVDAIEHRGQGYLIVRHGRPAAALVPVAVWDKWRQERQELFDLVRQVQAQHDDEDASEVERAVQAAQQGVRTSDPQ